MEMGFVHLSAIIVAIFQVLLSVSYPLGEYVMGGSHKVLPKKLRILSILNAIILFFISLIFLTHTNVLTTFHFLPTNILVCVITLYLGLNTVINLLSQSKKERFIMTPLSFIAFLLCLFVFLSTLKP